jgi:uncharacterized protein YbjQ (UPF0145 family)
MDTKDDSVGDAGYPESEGFQALSAGLQPAVIEQALQVAHRTRHIPDVPLADEPETDRLSPSEADDIEYDDLVEPYPPEEILDGFELTIEDFGTSWGTTVRGWVIDELGNTVWRPIVTTTDRVPNWEIESTLGLVTGEATLGIDSNAAGRILAEPGGRRNLEQRVHLDRTAAQQAMIEEAVARGAHAIVGVTAGYTPIGDVLMITCTGTAVTLRVPDEVY